MRISLDLHTAEFGYTEVIPPALVKDDTVYGTGQLPKFAGRPFHTDDGYWLIPTAEVQLTSLVAGDILRQDDLPLRYYRLDPLLSFRSRGCRKGYAWNDPPASVLEGGTGEYNPPGKLTKNWNA